MRMLVVACPDCGCYHCRCGRRDPRHAVMLCEPEAGESHSLDVSGQLDACRQRIRSGRTVLHRRDVQHGQRQCGQFGQWRGRSHGGSDIGGHTNPTPAREAGFPAVSQSNFIGADSSQQIHGGRISREWWQASTLSRTAAADRPVPDGGTADRPRVRPLRCDAHPAGAIAPRDGRVLPLTALALSSPVLGRSRSMSIGAPTDFTMCSVSFSLTPAAVMTAQSACTTRGSWFAKMASPLVGSEAMRRIASRSCRWPGRA